MGWFGSNKIVVKPTKADVKRMEAAQDVVGLFNALGVMYSVAASSATPQDDAEVVEGIQKALVGIGEAGVEPLIDALSGDYWGYAAEALGNIGDKRAVEPLIRIFIRLPSEMITDDGPLYMPAYLDNDTRTYLQNKLSARDVIYSLKKLPGVKAEFLRLELYDKAEEFYKYHGMLEEAAAMRRKKAEMAGPKTEIHGDYVDDRDTIVKDSVINRSNVGGGSSKMQELKELTEMKKEGLIDAAEFKQMKKEILGK